MLQTDETLGECTELPCGEKREHTYKRWCKEIDWASDERQRGNVRGAIAILEDIIHQMDQLIGGQAGGLSTAEHQFVIRWMHELGALRWWTWHAMKWKQRR